MRSTSMHQNDLGRFSRVVCLWLGFALISIFLASCTLALNPNSLETSAIPLMEGTAEIDFQELAFDSRLGKIIVPAGSTGKLALINPENFQIQLIDGSEETYSQNPEVFGITSAVAARNFIYAIDQSALKLTVIDPASGAIIGSAPVEALPEIVRFIPPTNELWVTEPSKEQIEIFTAPTEDPFTPVRSGIISIPKGPKSLEVDRGRGLAYTNQPAIGMTAVIQVQTHGMIDQWGNGCSDARGMDLDEESGFLFVACHEGKVVMLDVQNDGRQLASQSYGGEINSIAYNPRLQHVYMPSGASAIMAIFGLQKSDRAQASSSSTKAPGLSGSQPFGQEFSLVRLGTADTGIGAVCVTVDDKDQVWVCDPSKGQILLIRDTFPASHTTTSATE